MDEIQVKILHDLRRIAEIISSLDSAVGQLIGDMDEVIKGGKYVAADIGKTSKR